VLQQKKRRKGKGPHTNTTCASLRTEVHVSQQPKVQENSHSFFSVLKKRENKQIEKGKSSRHQKRLVAPALFRSSPTYKYPPPGTQTPRTAKAPSKTARLFQHPSLLSLCASYSHPSVQSAATTAVQFFTQIVGCRSRPLVHIHIRNLFLRRFFLLIGLRRRF
jgi:hypothetical protein